MTASPTGLANPPLTLAQIEAYAAQAGFPPADEATIAAIAEAESGGNPTAQCIDCVPGVREDSLGLTQINVDAHPDAASLNLFDPLTNLEEAFKVSSGGTNFNPWSTYTSGAYRSYLPPPGTPPASATLVGSYGGGIPNPTDPGQVAGAVGGAVGGVASSVASSVANTALKIVFLMGGIALVVAGVWRISAGSGVGEKLRGSAQSAAQVASVAAAA